MSPNIMLQPCGKLLKTRESSLFTLGQQLGLPLPIAAKISASARHAAWLQDCLAMTRRQRRRLPCRVFRSRSWCELSFVRRADFADLIAVRRFPRALDERAIV